jgi:hypothetical protein
MKTLTKLFGVVIVLLLVLTACKLDQMSVRWSIDTFVIAPPTVQVDYTVWNDGAYDLTGVNLEFGIYSTSLVDWISDWTPEFSLDQSQTKTGTFFLNIGVETVSGDPQVLGVDMDKPSD